MKKVNFKKINLINNLSEKTGFSASICKKLVDDLLMVIIKNIKTNNLNLKNFGTFKIINKRERIGRNPKSNKAFIISARKSLSFYASKKLLITLNKN